MAQILSNGIVQMRDGRMVALAAELAAMDIAEIARDTVAPIGMPGWIGGGGRGGPGPQGPKGQSGGGTGTQGAQGAQGNQGLGGAGTQGNQGPAGGGGTKHTAEVIVDLAGGADALTPAAGIALLPAGGGQLYIRKGTYSISPLTLSGKPIRIVGSGRGITILDLGSTLGGVFELDSDHKFSFESLTLKGDGATLNQMFLTDPVTGPTTANPVTIRDVDSTGLPVCINAGRASKWVVSDCEFLLGDVGGGLGPRFYTTADFSFLELSNVVAEVPGVPANGKGGAIANSPTVQAVNCTFGGVSTVGANSRLVNCNFTKSDTGAGIHLGLGDNCFLVGCTVDGEVSTDPTRRFNPGNFCSVIGNTFGASTIETMRLNKSGSRFIGNKNLTVSFLAGGDNNLFVGNEGMAGSVLSQTGNIIDGVQMGVSTQIGEGIAKAKIDTTAVGNVGTGEDDLITYTLPADALEKVESGVRIKAWGTTANNANAKTLRLKFGGTTILTTILTPSQAGFWEINAIVPKTGANTQDFNTSLIESPGTLQDVESGTAGETDTAAIIIKCTGEATANNDIVQEGLLVEVMN